MRVHMTPDDLIGFAAHFVETLVDPATGETQLDGWPVGTGWRYPQPRTLEQRMAHAQEFRFKFGFPNDLEVTYMNIHCRCFDVLLFFMFSVCVRHNRQ